MGSKSLVTVFWTKEYEGPGLPLTLSEEGISINEPEYSYPKNAYPKASFDL